MSGRFGSTRFWLASAGTLCGAAVLGLSLGAYVTGSPASRWEESASTQASLSGMQDTADLDAAAPRGPDEIKCRGCGPTLAERDRARDMAGLDLNGLIDGSRDPQVRAYMAQEEALPPPMPPTAQRLPTMVERFAAADDRAQPPVPRPIVPVQPAAASTAPIVNPAVAVVQPTAVTTTVP